MKVDRSERFGLSLTRPQAKSLSTLLESMLILSSREEPVQVSCKGHDLFPTQVNWNDIQTLRDEFVKVLGER